jgi:hypothetical protein
MCPLSMSSPGKNKRRNARMCITGACNEHDYDTITVPIATDASDAVVAAGARHVMCYWSESPPRS